LISNFKNYNNNFPEDYLAQTINVYPYFDSKKLKTELQILYSRSEFRTMAWKFSFFKTGNLSDSFSECVKLLKIIIIVPMSSTAESERCFSTLKRIKTFLRNTVDHDRLSSLAMLSIEKNFIVDIVNFNNNKVIDLFSISKERRLSTSYSKLVIK